MQLNLVPEQVLGLNVDEISKLQKLLEVYNQHLTANAVKNKYYEGKVTVNDVNLGIALPDGLRRLEIGCAWGAKTVDVLAARSMFDGFVGLNGEEVAELDQIAFDNDLIAEYAKACRDELKFGCTFATLSADERMGAKIRFHSPQTAAGLWNGEEGRIECGFAIIDTRPTSPPTIPINTSTKSKGKATAGRLNSTTTLTSSSTLTSTSSTMEETVEGTMEEAAAIMWKSTLL